MNIAKPFALAVGDYLELEDHSFAGPLVFETPDVFSTVRSGYAQHWDKNGAPINNSPRILTVMKGPVSIHAYIDRLELIDDPVSASFASMEILRAKAELRRIAGRTPAVAAPPETPPSIGALAESTIQAMMTKIVMEVLLPEIRKIVAEEVEAMALNTRRFVVTVENDHARRG